MQSDQLGLFSKMSSDSCPQPTMLSDACLRDLQVLMNHSPRHLNKDGGLTRALSLDPSMEWPGGFSMPADSASPNVVVESTLSDILETGPLPQKYFLSPAACRGIIRRAKKRGKELPQTLQHALEAVAMVGSPPAEASTSSPQSQDVSKNEILKESTPTPSQDTLFQ